MDLLFWKNRASRRRRSRKPLNTSFRQQRLKAWQPNLSPQGVLPMLIIVACIFAPIGVGLIVSAIKTQSIEIRYEYCESQANAETFSAIPQKYITSHFNEEVSVQPMWKLIRDSNDDIKCQLMFEIPNRIKKSIFIYYKLTNFYQNSRKYIESFDIHQINGKPVQAHHLDDNCKPFKEINGKAIYPCGMIANSLFNDTFSPQLTNINDPSKDFPLSNHGVAWSTDKHKFKTTRYTASEIVPPPSWAKMFPNGYNDDNIPDLHTWQELQVWMRTAALPKFYKLALKNDNHTSYLQQGTYTIDIGLNYPVLSFNGTKSFVLTDSNIVGARNITLGIVYFIVSGLCVLFGGLFLIKIIFEPKNSKADHMYLNYSTTHSSSIGHRRTTSSDTRNSIPIREIL